jgi:hypothetical protein
MSMNNYLGDELAYKVKALSLAISDADRIIHILQEENKTLKDILNDLMSIKKEDHPNTQEVVCV